MARTSSVGALAAACAALVLAGRCGSSSMGSAPPPAAGNQTHDAGSGSPPTVAPDAGRSGPDAGQAQHPPPLPDGGNPIETLSVEDAPDSLALDATRLYWSDRNPHCNGVCDVQVRTMPKSGGPSSTLATVSAESLSLAVDGRSVYFGGVVGRQSCGRTDCTPIWKLYRVAKSGGAVEELAGGVGSFDQIAVGRSAAFVTGVPEGHRWSEYGVVAIPKDGSGASLLASGQQSVDVLFAGGSVLWSVAEGIRAVDERGGTPRTVSASAGLPPTRLEADATYVYFIAGASLWAAPLEGGAPRRLREGDNAGPVTSLAVENGEVFFTQSGCISEVAADGLGAHCLAQTTLDAREVRADEVAVYAFEGNRLVRIRR